MPTPTEFKQDQPYRRGLILGLTIAEVMILLIFILLMMLASALANREEKIELLDEDNRLRMISILQEAYPDASTPDDYWEELTSAVQMRKTVEDKGQDAAKEQLAKDAEIGRRFRRLAEEQGLDDPQKALRFAEAGKQATEAAKRAGEKDPAAFIAKTASEARRGKAGEWPPFFSLSEAGGYYFDSGKATLRPEFRQNLVKIVIPLLVKNLQDYDVDVVEVIGHTDEVPMTGTSNLDSRLIEASANRFPIAGLRSNDNAGLAMARAVSVVQVLREDQRLRGVTILPLSGAQMIVPVDVAADGSQRSSDQSRRADRDAAAAVDFTGGGRGPQRGELGAGRVDEIDRALGELRSSMRSRTSVRPPTVNANGHSRHAEPALGPDQVPDPEAETATHETDYILATRNGTSDQATAGQEARGEEAVPGDRIPPAITGFHNSRRTQATNSATYAEVEDPPEEQDKPRMGPIRQILRAIRARFFGQSVDDKWG